ncbi:MAG: hypothetical protein ABIN13_12780 [Mucilaginibacter sp.]
MTTKIKIGGAAVLLQYFKNVAPNQFLHLTEGNNIAEVINLKKLAYKKLAKPPVCMPMISQVK